MFGTLLAICYLQALRAKVDDVSSSQACFDDPSNEHHRSMFSDTELTLEVMGWDSHEVVTRVAEILLREKLGYTRVYVKRYREMTGEESPSVATYRRLASGEVSFNFELWPALEANMKAMRTFRLSETGSDLDQIGYKARSGWYVPFDALHSMVQAWIQNTVGQGQSGSNFSQRSMSPYDEFSTLSGLAQSMPYMVRADSLPIVNTCGLLLSDPDRFHGAYDCTTGTWLPSNPRCCARGHASCAALLPPCVALLVDDPTYDAGFNERNVIDSGLPLQIVYGNKTVALEQSIALQKPLLFYHWEPHIFGSHFKQLRVTMQDPMYCDPNATDNARNPHAPHACDYPQQRVHKGGYHILRTSAKDAWTMAKELRIEFSDVKRLLNLSATHGDSFLAACAWLKESPATLEFCTITDSFAAHALIIGGILLVLACIIAFCWDSESGRTCGSPLRRLYMRIRGVASHVATVAPSTSPTTPMGGGLSVSMCSDTLVVLEDENYVIVPLIRIGSVDAPATVEVFTEDRSARFGEHYLQIESRAQETTATKQTGKRRNLTLEFAPGAMVRAVCVALRSSPGFCGPVKFSVQIRPLGDAKVGPVVETIVTILNIDKFPYNHGANSENVPTLGVNDITLSFLRECMLDPVVAKNAVKFQCAGIVRAAFDYFITNYLYEKFIEYGLEQYRLDLSITIALYWALGYVVKCYIFYYDPGVYQIIARLQILLLEKYLSFGEADHMQHPVGFKYRYHWAISRSTFELAYKTWLGTHNLLVNLYRIVFSVVFMVYSLSESGTTTIGLVKRLGAYSVLLIVLSSWTIHRRLKLRRLRSNVFNAEERRSTSLHATLSSWRFIQLQGTSQQKLKQMYDDLMTFFAADCDLWYHTVGTDWVAKLIIMFVILVLVSVGPLIVSRPSPDAPILTTASLLAIIRVLSSLGKPIRNLTNNFSSVYTSGAVVQEIASLLNSGTDAKKNMRTAAVPEQSEFEGAIAGEIADVPRSSTQTEIDQLYKKALTSACATVGQVYGHGQDVAIQVKLEQGGEEVAKPKIFCSQSLITGMKSVISSAHPSRPSFMIHKLSYAHPLRQGQSFGFTFDRLALVEEREVARERVVHSTTLLPSGGIIGLYRGDHVDAQAPLLLSKILAGELEPSSGLARCLPPMKVRLVQQRVGLVSTHDTTVRQVLQGSDSEKIASDEDIWNLCKRVGMSQAILHSSSYPGEGWGTLTVSLGILGQADYGKLMLTAALLHDPDALILCGVGDHWGQQEQVQLMKLLRSFLDGTALDSIMRLGKVGEVGNKKRTVIWSSDDSNVCELLQKEHTVSLTLVSPSLAKLDLSGA